VAYLQYSLSLLSTVAICKKMNNVGGPYRNLFCVIFMNNILYLS
jgi:hypothetical protein